VVTKEIAGVKQEVAELRNDVGHLMLEVRALRTAIRQ
jgi:hypothetical protein